MQRLTLLWKRFTPLEENLLVAVRTALPAEARAIFDAQVTAIGHVQRLPPNWTEISFYPRKRGKKAARFPRTDEFPLAELRFFSEGKKYKAKLSCIGGRIFDFAIIPGAKKIAFSNWEGEPEVRLLEDPMAAPAGGRPTEPLSPVWRAILERESGQVHPDWTLYSEESAYRVVLDDAEYLVLAELKGDQFILQRLEPWSDLLFYLASHEDTPAAIPERIELLLSKSG